MDKKGFTLVELLGVIIILGILAMIAFPLLLNQVNKTKKEISDATKTIIVEAAKDYYDKNIDEYKKIEGNTYCINLSKLIDENYLSRNIKDTNLNDLDASKQVKMTYTNSKFNYEIVDSCTSSN